MNSAERLRFFTERSNNLHAEYLTDESLFQRYAFLVAWQERYLMPFYAEFRVRPEEDAAVRFVVSDLAGSGISARDRDLGRVVPLMIALLPEKALDALARAMELNARVLAINLAVARDFLGPDSLECGISEAEYCTAFRQVTTLDECIELTELAYRIGLTLRKVVRIPMIGITLRAMRAPAHAAGFGALQDFLETGYRRFRGLKDVGPLLRQVADRMTEVFARICEAAIETLDRDRVRPSVTMRQDMR